ncbi:type II toxin-antitoxin system HicB family antitoxin [Candidatus Uhrbacteria bacterium]|nr:type II toxin-antitoxin system HicB family antitoxin [Candidatus Uhrbacteria bacterium]
MKKPLRKKVQVSTIYGEFECLFESNHPERGYTVTVSKIRGVVTCGDTMKEARAMAREAIELHCECLIEEGLAELHIFEPMKHRQRIKQVVA